MTAVAAPISETLSGFAVVAAEIAVETRRFHVLTLDKPFSPISASLPSPNSTV